MLTWRRKSTLRNRQTVPVASQYRGSRIGRERALEADIYHDPFNQRFDDRSGSEYSTSASDKRLRRSPGYTEGNVRRTTVRTTYKSGQLNGAVPVMDDASVGSSPRDQQKTRKAEEEDGEGGGATAEEGEQEDDLSNRTDEDQALEVAMDRNKLNSISHRAELRTIMGEGQQNLAATIVSAMRADADKGEAVKRQRAMFDTYLNTRIRLQKALIATNTLPISHAQEAYAGDIAGVVNSAELAALRLWNTLDDFRTALHTARTGVKRKRVAISQATVNKEVWELMQAHEASNLPNRRAVLEKWSAKARGVTALPASGRLRITPVQQTIVDVLADQLSTSERLIKRTRMARSCAPLHVSKGIGEASYVYDDADFYGLLLKELLEHRSVDTAANVQLDGALRHWEAAREAKTKKNVDTKASKGRKLRYVLHEKLQSFMAPEDRGKWDQERTGELFGSLFGRRLGLDEPARHDDGEEEMEEQSLPLFGGRY